MIEDINTRMYDLREIIGAHFVPDFCEHHLSPKEYGQYLQSKRKRK